MTTRLGDRYVLGEVIGTGGGSTVRVGYDDLLARTVAVKLINGAAASTADPAGRNRFLQEARSMARFDHPNVIHIFDAGEADGVLYMVMEFVDGTNLAHVIAEESPVPPGRAVDIIGQVLDALAAVHASGLVHRDIKPANVLIDRSGQVFLTDFGIAKQLEDIEHSLTAVGMVMGTPAYLPPEQAAGGDLGPWTDIYATGLLLAELAGDVTTPLASVIERATREEPTERFQSASEMADALRASARTETAMMPAGMPAGMMPAGALALSVTQAIAGHRSSQDDTATSIMPTETPSDGPLVPVVHGSRSPLLGARSRPGWLVPAAVIGTVCLVLAAGALASRDNSMFENLPTPPTTVPSVATTVPAPIAATTVPVAPVAETPPPAVVADRGGGGNGGKPDKPGRPDKP